VVTARFASRHTQAVETVEMIQRSNADIKIFGGDINAMPVLDDYQGPML
jgi:hypothetical protein